MMRRGSRLSDQNNFINRGCPTSLRAHHFYHSAISWFISAMELFTFFNYYYHYYYVVLWSCLVIPDSSVNISSDLVQCTS